ncbi:MAG: DUF4834 family protein [Paludibacter sp.]
MLGFLFFIVIFILVIGLVIISTIFGFLRSIFSFGKRNTQTQSAHSQTHEQPASKSKIFGNNEGEYVDFEEIK